LGFPKGAHPIWHTILRQQSL